MALKDENELLEVNGVRKLMIVFGITCLESVFESWIIVSFAAVTVGGPYTYLNCMMGKRFPSLTLT